MKILIADDEPVSRLKLEAILSGLASCTSTSDGQKALAEAKNAAEAGRPFDLICLDIQMPVLDGYETCRKLKSDPLTKGAPVVFITGSKDEINEATAFDLGAVDYIAKPFKPKIVQARVKTHLELKGHQDYLEEIIQDRTRKVREAHMEILNRLAQAAEFRDNETGSHVKRLSHYCRIVGQGLGLSSRQVDLLFHSSALHDVGKIGIPDAILLKPGRLTADEFTLMKTHTTIGAKLLDMHESELLDMARSVALTHHEKWDGSGYPQGLAGDSIPLVGRITAVCDVFDALTTKRVYKEAWPLEKAIEQMTADSGRHFDPDIMEAFLQHLDRFRQIQQDFADSLSGQ